TSGHLYHLAEGDVHREGAYSPMSGWDDAVTPIPEGEPGVSGKGPPAAAIAGTSRVLAFSGEDGALAVQAETSGAWDPPSVIPDAQAFPGLPPALIALSGAPDDLLL